MYVKELVTNYTVKKEIKTENNLKYIIKCTNKIYQKLFMIALSVFILDKSMFFRIIRKNDEEQEEFFEEVSKIYLGLVNDNREDCTIEGFARKLFEND